MTKWSQNGRALGLASCLCVFALACTLNPIPGKQAAMAAGVPPSMAQGFSEIVKKVTPAVVNIAVTGGSEGGRGRRPLPPGPFGGPPGGDLLADLLVVRSQAANCRHHRPCLQALTDGLNRVQDPALFWIPTGTL